MKRKKDSSSILASLFAILSFVMIVIILIYFINGKTNQTATIILFCLGGTFPVLFVVFTIIFFLAPPSKKN